MICGIIISRQQIPLRQRTGSRKRVESANLGFTPHIMLKSQVSVSALINDRPPR